MRNAKLTILASLSLAMLAVLAWGHVGDLSLEVLYLWATPSGAATRGAGVYAFGGELMVWWSHDTNIKHTAQSPGLRVSPYFDLRQPLQPGWLWLFLRERQGSQPGHAQVVLICPLWFAAIPFTIAPIAWLRRRRRRETRGFAVEGSQPSQPASEQPNQPPEMPTDRQTPTGV